MSDVDALFDRPREKLFPKRMTEDEQKAFVLEWQKMYIGPKHCQTIIMPYVPNDDGTDPVEFEQDDPDSPLS